MTLQEYLNHVGQMTLQQITSLLREKNIRGTHEGCNCPIFHLLRDEGYEQVINVGRTHLAVKGFSKDSSLPESLIDFISRFDASEFPEFDISRRMF
jgi:hypothetical protein